MRIAHPKYGIEIIVFVQYDEQVSSYCTEKSLWIMDYPEFQSCFPPPNFLNRILKKSPEIPKARLSTPVLDRSNWSLFAEEIRQMEVTMDTLRDWIHSTKPSFPADFVHLLPSLLVDFDRELLVDDFYEPYGFNDFVPINWSCKVNGIHEELDTAYHYWK